MNYFFLLFLVFSLLFAVASAIKGEIITCPRCKLNALPQVRKFIKETGQADSYENVTITFIFGRTPTLTIRDDDYNVLEVIDLSPFTISELHALFQSKGFKRKYSANSSYSN